MLKTQFESFGCSLLVAMSLCYGVGCKNSPNSADDVADVNAPAVVSKTYEVWESTPAPNRGFDPDLLQLGRGYPYDHDWERWSYPLGNGMLGANVFGRTDVERIQLTEKTILNGSAYGRGAVTNAAEVYLDFGHDEFANYRRALNLNDGTKYVTYQHGGVNYNREYFVNYPDDVMVVRLTADQASALSFILRPEIPFPDAVDELDTKSNLSVVADGDTITMSGTIDFYNVNFNIQIKVVNEGGSLEAGDATIRVNDANAVTLLIAVGTNYELGPHIFLNDPKEILNPAFDPGAMVSKKLTDAAARGYGRLRTRHLEDYQTLFNRVDLDLQAAKPALPTSQLLLNYRNGVTDPYLEELIFQFGRYLLIASSRESGLPAHLQGAWSAYEVSPWCAGYWHNINVQMNYWGAKSANLAETFQAYVNYFEAYLPKAREFATHYISVNNPDALSEDPYGNGWILGTGANAFRISGSSDHSGPGTGGFTTQMLMEYYNFTQDKEFLREVAYPALYEMSVFFSKTLRETDDGLLLVFPSASPEVRHEQKFYQTKGATYDQGFVWENHNNVLIAAGILGIEDPFHDVIREQIPRLDPILIGESGQIKEYREETTYSSIGDDPHHRHISHLCPLYPGTLINKRRDWMDAASVTLNLRGQPGNGWATAHRMTARARLFEAEEAYALYQLFITDRTANNLWSMHPPFQIDGNFGIMSGVVEMLLQSHMGVIEPLPAVPDAWMTGRFSGLIARGNFEVGATWQDKVLQELRVHSRSGVECRVQYPNITDATVFDASGRVVAVEKEGGDIIAFATQVGARYTIVFQ